MHGESRIFNVRRARCRQPSDRRAARQGRWRRRSLPAGVAASSLVWFAAVTTLAAPPRTRTLTYDAKQKDLVEQTPPPLGTQEGDLHAIRVLLKDERFRKALAATKTFRKKYGVESAFKPDLLLCDAEAYIGRKEYDEAHDALTKFLGEFAGMSLTDEALRMQLVVAEAYLGGAKRKVWGMRLFSGEDKALEILDEVSSGYPESGYAPLAIKIKADHLYRTGEYDLAEFDYARLLREHPRSRYHEYTLLRSAQSALASFGGVEFDEAALIEADERFSEYAARYPAGAKSEGVDRIRDGISESRAEKELLIGQYYERTDHLGSAVFQYRGVLKEFPDSIAARRAAQRLEAMGVIETASAEGSTNPKPEGATNPP